MDLLEPALERVARIETAAADALAPAEEVRVDGWRLRFNHGVTRRANSVLAERAGRRPLATKLREVEAFYRGRGVPARVQVGPASRPASLDLALAERGWRREAGARVLWRGVAPTRRGDGEPDEAAARRDDDPALAWAIVVSDAPTDAYLRVQEAVTPSAGRWAPARAAAVAEAGLAPWHLVATDADGRPVAAGLAVHDPRAAVVGLFALATLPAARGRGAASALVAHALARAVHAGAVGAYLQVDGRNDAAARVYRRAGFTEHHRYHYRVAPDA